jgi:hypothetical protein
LSVLIWYWFDDPIEGATVAEAVVEDLGRDAGEGAGAFLRKGMAANIAAPYWAAK